MYDDLPVYGNSREGEGRHVDRGALGKLCVSL